MPVVDLNTLEEEFPPETTAPSGRKLETILHFQDRLYLHTQTTHTYTLPAIPSPYTLTLPSRLLLLVSNTLTGIQVKENAT